MSDVVVLQRLLLVVFLSGIIGFERERHGRAAGFRTHILVAVGSCLMMMTGLYLMETFAGHGGIDPTRLAAQVVSGIGFLGAGTILQFRASIRGLTTAASLWAAGGIGIAVGAGFLFAAVATALLVFLVLIGLASWERRMRREWYRVLVAELGGGNETFSRLREVLANHEVEIQDFEIRPTAETGVSHIELNMKFQSEREEGPILGEVLRIEGIRRAHWI